MSMPNPKTDTTYTYEDYLNWGEDERIEIIDGKAVMQATPTRKHQSVCGQLYAQLLFFLKGKDCKVYIAPFSVRLFETDDDTSSDIKTVVEPDISVICDENKLDDKGCKGAPEMVVEILSPSTAKYDMILKLNKYQEAGVKEYWIVDPEEETVHVLLSHGHNFFTVKVYNNPDIVKVNVLEGCSIDLAEVFAE